MPHASHAARDARVVRCTIRATHTRRDRSKKAHPTKPTFHPPHTRHTCKRHTPHTNTTCAPPHSRHPAPRPALLRCAAGAARAAHAARVARAARAAHAPPQEGTTALRATITVVTEFVESSKLIARATLAWPTIVTLMPLYFGLVHVGEAKQAWARASGGRRQAAGGRRQAAGGRRQAVGGRLQALGGRVCWMCLEPHSDEP